MGAPSRGMVEPLALIAATLGAVMAMFYLWLIHHQGDQPLPWVLSILIGGSVLAAYGALWRAPCRRAALSVAVVALMVLGVLGILSIGLPILVAGVLALLSLLRPARRRAL